MVGPLGHILKNRFYIGEVLYKGEVHAGQHAAIVDRDLFAAVQNRLHNAAVMHKIGRRNTTFLFAGFLFDDCGHRMTPSHANKQGLRYRYYVLQAVLQNRKADTGTVSRVSAPDLEALVVASLRYHLDGAVPRDPSNMVAALQAGIIESGQDRDVLEAHVQRVVIGARQFEITLRDLQASDGGLPPRSLTVPWTAKAVSVRKGITHDPSGGQNLDPHTREVLLAAIGRAKGWVRDLMAARVASFEEIARREGKAERHIRLLASLAFVSPRIVAMMINGHAPTGLTVTGLVRALPHAWSEQARQLGIA
jgi:site-specific DNA recombinase